MARHAGPQKEHQCPSKDEKEHGESIDMAFFWGLCVKDKAGGHLGGSVVEHLPLAQVVILGPGDPVLHWAPCREPASPSAYVSAFSLCLS